MILSSPAKHQLPLLKGQHVAAPTAQGGGGWGGFRTTQTPFPPFCLHTAGSCPHLQQNLLGSEELENSIFSFPEFVFVAFLYNCQVACSPAAVSSSTVGFPAPAVDSSTSNQKCPRQLARVFLASISQSLQKPQ